jgi:hypothetical protein
MARSLYGGGSDDYLYSLVSFGGNQLVARSGNATVTFWSAQTGGTQYTDLLLNGSPVTSITTTGGQVPAFQGPDGITVMWADAGAGRVEVYAYNQTLTGSISWLPNTPVTTGQVVVAPDGSSISRISNGTTRATFDSTEKALWNVVLTNAGTLEQAALSATYVPLSSPTNDAPALGIYFPESQGAKGDGSHDDTAAMIAAAAKVSALRQAVIGGNVFAPGGTLKLTGTYLLTSISAPIVLSCNVDASEATVIVPTGYAQAVFVVGHETSGKVLASAKIHMPTVTKAPGVTSMVAGSIGITFQNLYHSKVYCKRQTYFETGVLLTGLGQGSVYNEMNLGWTDLCKIGHALIPQSGGWVNQNNIIGGISQSPNTFDGGLTTDVRRPGYRHVKIDGSAGAATVNANTFDVSYEGNLSELYFDTKASNENTWLAGCRFEQGTASTATTLTTDTFTSTAHGLVAGDMVVFFANVTRPSGMQTGVAYYVSVVVDANNFKVSETQGGPTVSFSSNGSGVVYYTPPRIQFDNTGAPSSGGFGNRIQEGYYSYPGPLDVRYLGTTGLQSYVAPFAPRHGDQMVARNRIRNGNFRTNQRGYASGAFIASGVYGFDGWKSTTSGTTLTFTAAPQGQQVTLNSGSIAQIIEQGNVEAGIYTLSWRGGAQARVYNVGATAPSYAPSPVLVTLDGTANVTVEFIGNGDLGRVQLERGAVATPFERDPISVELERCKRYFQRTGTGAAGNVPLGMGIANSTTSAILPLRLPVEMRAVPTATVTSPTTFRLNIGTSVINPTAISLNAVSTAKEVRIDYSVAAGLTNGGAVYFDTGGGILDLSAEL